MSNRCNILVETKTDENLGLKQPIPRSNKLMHQSSTEKSLLAKLSDFLEPASFNTTYLTHGIHPYPAKYIPQLPRLIIESHTNERNTILDPFCGSGTTLLEACILGRYSMGFDSNPIATLVSRAKTMTLTELEIKYARRIVDFIANADVIDVKTQFNESQLATLNHWFQPNMVRELAWIRKIISNTRMERVQTLLLCVFSSIIVNTSNQESDTRYAAKEKNLPDHFAVIRFVQKFLKTIQSIEDLSKIDSARRNTPQIFTLDSRNITSEMVPDNSIDLVVTSPPYPNSYDYYLYHKLRMLWLGYDHRVVQKEEIGSRHEHSSLKQPIETFEVKMLPIMLNVARVLKPSKLAYFFVGDGIINGEYINISDTFRNICKDTNLALIAESEYSLEKVSRSFHEKRMSANKNQQEKKQRILIFESKTPKGIYPSITNRTMASPKPERAPTSLESHIPLDGTIISIESDDQNRHIHALGKYPSKFIPAIPRWAINHFSHIADTVLDPFAGSATTAVESLIHGRSAISLDISPFACLLAVAKTTKVLPKVLDLYTSRLERVLENPESLPPANRLQFELDTFWFNTSHLVLFERIRQYIIQNMPEELQSFFLATLATTIKSFSYLDEGQIKVKRNPKKVLVGTPAPNQVLLKRLPRFTTALKEFTELSSNFDSSHTVINSSTEIIDRFLPQAAADLIVTSPPYINAMNYSMTHRYENILLQLVDVDEYKTHQQQYFGTERVYSKDFATPLLLNSSFSYADELNSKIMQIFDKEPKRAYIVSKFFMQMEAALKSCTKILKPGGQFILVAGSNVIRDTPIDTFSILVSILEALGLERRSSFHYEIIKQAFKLTRHTTANIIKMDGVAIMEKRA